MPRVRSAIVMASAVIGMVAAAAGSADAAAHRMLLISATSLDFGDVIMGTSSPQQFVTVRNVSPVAVTMSGIGNGITGPFGGSDNCQGVTLSPNQSCHMAFGFSPSALGPVTGGTSGSWNGQNYSLTFAGNGVRRFLISPTTIDFGDVPVGTMSPAQTSTVTNVSNAAVMMSEIGGGSAGMFIGGQDCTGQALNPGQSCHIIIAFSPTATGLTTSLISGLWNGQPFNILCHGTGFVNTHGDFDGDGKTDLGIFRPSTGQWSFANSSTNFTTNSTLSLGTNTDRPVPGDYDGDGKLDLAIYRPSTGQWLITTSSSSFLQTLTFSWGDATDIPVPGDYDGDGKTDMAVFRPSDGTWYILRSSTNNTPETIQWGISTDIPVPGDYDGDGKTDVAVFRPSNGAWYVLESSTGNPAVTQFGNAADGDVTVQADYDGDGKTDIAVFRPTDNNWYILNSHDGSLTVVQWGVGSDVMIPGDYDGDGKADVAVFRPSNATWYILRSSTGTPMIIQFGNANDIPLPETYLGRWVP